MFHRRKNRMKKIRFESTILQKQNIFIQRKNKKRIRNNQTISIFFLLTFLFPIFFTRNIPRKKTRPHPFSFFYSVTLSMMAALPFSFCLVIMRQLTDLAEMTSEILKHSSITWRPLLRI